MSNPLNERIVKIHKKIRADLKAREEFVRACKVQLEGEFTREFDVTKADEEYIEALLEVDRFRRTVRRGVLVMFLMFLMVAAGTLGGYKALAHPALESSAADIAIKYLAEGAITFCALSSISREYIISEMVARSRAGSLNLYTPIDRSAVSTLDYLYLACADEEVEYGITNNEKE